jgi:hypothetical protein
MPLSCESNALVQAATCLDCTIPEAMKDAVLIYILSANAGVSSDPQSLIDGARQIDCCVPKGMRPAIITQLLCTLAAKARA